MPLMKRPGVVGRSTREYVTEPAAALAFFETKMRPTPVAAHSVPVSLAARSIATTFDPARVPYEAPVRSRAPVAPIGWKSPQFGSAEDVVNSEQCASRKAGSPPQSWVRQMLCEPWKIEPAVAGFGSAMIGA